MNSNELNKAYDINLEQFIENAHANTISTMKNNKAFYNRLYSINESFRKIIPYINNSSNWFSGFFLFRTHSCYLAAIQLATSGQLPEAYMVLRGCLENSLYGLSFFKYPSYKEIWLKRHDDPKAKSKVRNLFQTSKLLKILKSLDTNLNDITSILYEQTIDYGAHPNERSILTNIDINEDVNEIKFIYHFFCVSQLPFELCLKTIARIGICSLKIFQIVFKTRYELLGLSDEIGKLSNGL